MAVLAASSPSVPRGCNDGVAADLAGSCGGASLFQAARAGDHVVEAIEGAGGERVEVDRAVGVAGVEGLARPLDDLLVGELDHREDGRVGAAQLVDREPVLAGVEDVLAGQLLGIKARSSMPCPGGATGASRSTRKLE